tara:strand:+ start:3090 stop:3260 length:171 start_codon:yes stop_codon:yes gene_type:complete
MDAEFCSAPLFLARNRRFCSVPKLNVAGSSPVSRSYTKPPNPLGFGGFFSIDRNPH